MIGSTIRGFSLKGQDITGIVCDKVNLPVPMKLPGAAIGSEQKTIVPCDCYIVYDAQKKTHMVPCNNFLILSLELGYSDPGIGGQDPDDDDDLSTIMSGLNA